MSRKEFRAFMDRQILEIKRYLCLKSKSNPKMTSNEIAIEWIRKYSKIFEQRWKNHKY